MAAHLPGADGAPGVAGGPFGGAGVSATVPLALVEGGFVPESLACFSAGRSGADVESVAPAPADGGVGRESASLPCPAVSGGDGRSPPPDAGPSGRGGDASAFGPA